MYPIIQDATVSVSATLCTQLSKMLPFLSRQTRVTKLLTNEVVYMHIMHRCIFAPKHVFQT